MCTITIEDNLVEQLRPALGADSDVKDWIQRQIELAVLQYVQQLKSKSMRQESIRRIKAIAEADGSTLSLRDFEGVLPASQTSIEDLRDEYISEKLQVAVSSGCQYLLTFNSKDYPTSGNQIEVMTPQQLLDNYPEILNL